MKSNKNLYLIYIEPIGLNFNNEWEYEFLFSDSPDTVWGEDWAEQCPSACDSLRPDDSMVSVVKRLSTMIPFSTAQKNSCFSMQDCIDGIIALAWEDISDYDEYPEPFRIVSASELIRSRKNCSKETSRLTTTMPPMKKTRKKHPIANRRKTLRFSSDDRWKNYLWLKRSYMDEYIFKGAVAAISEGDYSQSDVKAIKEWLDSLSKKELSLRRKLEKSKNDFVKAKEKTSSELKSVRNEIKEIKMILKKTAV